MDHPNHGIFMPFNTILIVLLARPRQYNRTKGPLVDLSAFKDPNHLFFSVGMFFALWGIYIAYFYVCIGLIAYTPIMD
jgi:hypothetical protein